MSNVLTIGEILVEIMRKNIDIDFDQVGDFVGPFPSGAPAIFADAVARLGHNSTIIGGVGTDDFGSCIINRLESDCVNTNMIKKSKNLSTGVAFVTYFSDGSRKFIYHMNNSAAGIISKSNVSSKKLEDYDAIHINGSSLTMGEEMKKACYKATKIANNQNMVISLDPNVRTELEHSRESKKIIDPILKNTSIVTPTIEELRTITKEEKKKKAIKKLLKDDIDLVALKKGEKGCELWTKDNTVKIPPLKVEEIDPTGAGDAFSAAIVTGWLENMNLKKLGRYANIVGSQAVTEKGPMEGLPNRDKVEKILE